MIIRTRGFNASVFPEDFNEPEDDLLVKMDNAIANYTRSKFFGGKEAYETLFRMQGLDTVDLELVIKIVEFKRLVDARHSSYQGVSGTINRIASNVINASYRIFNKQSNAAFESSICNIFKTGFFCDIFSRIDDIRVEVAEFVNVVMECNFRADQLFEFSKLLMIEGTGVIESRNRTVIATKDMHSKIRSLSMRVKEKVIEKSLTELVQRPKEASINSLIVDEQESMVLASVLELFGLIETQRFTLAKLLVKTNPDAALQGIARFKLTKEHSFEIASNLIEELSESRDSSCIFMKLPGQIKKFNLTDDQLFKVANLLVEKGMGFASDVAKFNLTKTQLWTFANKFVAIDPYDLMFHIKKFSLTLDQRFEISKCLTKNNASEVFRHINRLNLKDDQLLELAKLIIVKEPSVVVDLWKELDLSGSSQGLDVLAVGVANNPVAMTTYFKISEAVSFGKRSDLVCFFQTEKALKKEIFYSECSILNELAKKTTTKIEDEKLILFKWLGYAEMCRKFYGVSKLSAQEDHLLEKIFDLRHPALRYKISKCLFQVLAEPSLRALLESNDLADAFSKEFTVLFRPLLTSLLSKDLRVIDLKEIVYVLNFECYKDAPLRKIVISGVLALLENQDLAHAEKIRILKVVFPSNEIEKIQEDRKSLELKNQDFKVLSRKADVNSSKEVKKLKAEIPLELEKLKVDRKALISSINKSLQLMETLINMDSAEKLKEVTSPKDLEEILQGMFADATGIGEVENFAEKYLKTFATFRSSESILIYAGNFKQLFSKNGLAEAFSALKVYVEAVLNGTLSTTRYQSESSEDHLSILFKGRDELRIMWIQGQECAFKDFINVDSQISSSLQFDVRKFLHEKICLDNHIPAEKIAYLEGCLRNPSGIEMQKASLETALETEEDPDAIAVLHLQKELIILLDANKTNDEKAQIFHSEIKCLIESAFSTEEQFKWDLQALGSALLAKKPDENLTFEGWTVVDTDTAEDTFMCGTEVLASCQNINGSPELNKCLLAYCLDGKNRLVAVKNERGEIVARAIMRILWDEKAKVPVIFKERMYSRPNLDARIEKALDKMFIERSKALNLPLVTSLSSEVAFSYPNPLYSLSSKAPFEYVDAGRIGVTTGKFVIESSAYVMF